MDAYDPNIVALGIIWYVCFLFSFTCHEAAHAWAAKRGGDLTAYAAGSLTLNPMPHMRREPLGTIIVPIVSYLWMGFMIGWASAPFDARWQYRHPRRAAWMALAGPLANFAIVVVVGILIRALIMTGALSMPNTISFVSIVAGPEPGAPHPLAIGLSILFALNLWLGVFNLIPVPPLDGITVLGLFLSDDRARAVNEFMRGGPIAFVGLFLAWRLSQFLVRPAFSLAIDVLYPGRF